MNIGYVSVLLLVLAIALLFWGAFGVAKYAFRISSGKGVATLLFPPYTFYFSFYELEEEGKERPIFLWMWGLVVTIVVLGVFWQPLQYVATGRAAELSEPVGVDAAVEKYKDQSKAVPVTDDKDDEPEEKNEPAEEVASTNNAGTNNTNGSTAGSTAGSTTGSTNGGAGEPSEAAPKAAETP